LTDDPELVEPRELNRAREEDLPHAAAADAPEKEIAAEYARQLEIRGRSQRAHHTVVGVSGKWYSSRGVFVRPRRYSGHRMDGGVGRRMWQRRRCPRTDRRA